MHHLIVWRRTVAVLHLTSYTITATGCTGWKNRGGDAAAVITPTPAPVTDIASSESSGVPWYATPLPVHADTPDTVRRIRITTTQGTVELHNPRVANDSLYGQQTKNGPETAFALGEVTKVETHGLKAVNTGLLVVGLMAASLVVVVGGFVVTGCDPVYGC